MENSHTKIATTVINWFYLIVLNLLLMLVIGFMTLDSEANLNSRIGAFLLSILIPQFIVSRTKEMSGLERMIKFGHGFIAYVIFVLIVAGVRDAIFSGLVPCLLISIGLLYGGNLTLKVSNQVSNPS